MPKNRKALNDQGLFHLRPLEKLRWCREGESNPQVEPSCGRERGEAEREAAGEILSAAKELAGAGRGNRTPKGRSPADFESAASASSAIPARLWQQQVSTSA